MREFSKLGKNNLKRWVKLESKLVYKSEYFSVFSDMIEIPNGSKLTYEWFSSPDFCIIVPLFKDRFVMIENYRYPADRYSLEFPAGHLEEGEDIFQAAKRELLEETGYEAKQFKYLGWYYVSSRSLQKGHVFIAKELTKTKTNREPSELQRIKIVSERYILSALRTNRITHAATIIAFAFYKNLVI
ncbi:MAG TPA: NUDIX hydrolase [Geobacterales bacterium]|nr:NUDIX hydrolase [Geobacterales bacterium]